MREKIWAVLEEYAGRWVAVDRTGGVVDHAEQLPELRRRASGRAEEVTIVFAAASTAERGPA